jgi:hypothetical protein
MGAALPAAFRRSEPAFREGGTITAGNAPGVNTGAAAMVLADEAWAEWRGLAPVARLVSYGIAAVEHGMFGLGPIPAVKRALERAGWSLGMVERVKINEAFAAIAVAVTRELGLPQDIVNIEGGAIAHGHPIGATGACDAHAARGSRQLEMDIAIAARTKPVLRGVRFQFDLERTRRRFERVGAPHKPGREGPPGIFWKAEVDRDTELDPGCVALRHLDVNPELVAVRGPASKAIFFRSCFESPE